MEGLTRCGCGNCVCLLRLLNDTCFPTPPVVSFIKSSKKTQLLKLGSAGLSRNSEKTNTTTERVFLVHEGS